MQFKVEKMVCGGCVNNVKTKLEALDGVTEVKVDLASAIAEVEGTVDAQVVVDTLAAAGYPATLLEG